MTATLMNADAILRDAAVLLRHEHPADVLLQALDLPSLHRLEAACNLERQRRGVAFMESLIPDGGLVTFNANQAIHCVRSAKRLSIGSSSVFGLHSVGLLCGWADQVTTRCNRFMFHPNLRPRGPWAGDMPGSSGAPITCVQCLRKEAA